MRELEVYLLKAIRECNRRILEIEQGKELGKTHGKLRDGGEYGTVNYLLIHKIDPDPTRKYDYLSREQDRAEVARLILEAVRGGRSDKNDNRLGISFDGGQLNLAEILALKKRLETVYTSITGIPSPEKIDTDDELRNINSYEYLRLLADKIPSDLRRLRGFRNVDDYCSSNSKYDVSKPYGNYYTAFLLALEAYVRNLRRQRADEIKRINEIKKEIEKSAPPKPVYNQDEEERVLNYLNLKLRELDPLIELVYSNPNFAIDRAYSMIREDVQSVRQTDESELKKAVEKRLTRGGSSAVKRKSGANVDTPRSAESPLARLWANISSRFKPMMTTSQPSEVHLHYKTADDPLQIRFGTQGQIDKSRFHANPLFEQFLEMKQRKFEAKLQTCDLMVMSEAPTIAALPRLAIRSNAAFVRVNNDIYYVNRAANVCKKLDLEPQRKQVFLQGYDRAALRNNESRALRESELKTINENITDIHAQTQNSYQANKVPPRILHIYFNNLSRVGGAGKKFDLKNKDREAYLTRELERLEDKPGNENVAVITLPSDEGMMDHHLADDRVRPNAGNYSDVKSRILAIANGSSTETHKNDFHISDRIKACLYGDGFTYNKSNENAILSELLEKSFSALGFQPGAKLSQADQQAVYFHFIKFELTDYIIAKLGPESFNFSCKDAIDRGGVSSAYYNLVKSISRGNPISQEEFERLLHGAPTLVKGRGLNKHTHLIWNAVDAYLEANKNKAGIPSWLITWRDKHALPGTPQYYITKLDKYISQREKEGNYFTFLGRHRKMSKDVKLTVAKGVLTELKKLKDTRDSNVQAKYVLKGEVEKAAAHDKRLGGIISDLTKHNLLVLESPAPQQRHDSRMII